MAIPFDYTSEYKRKLRTPEEAARVVKSGDWLDISMGGAFPSLMDEAIAKRKDELRGVKIRGYLIQQPIQMVECDPSREHFIYNSWHMSAMSASSATGACAISIPWCSGIWEPTMTISSR